jgi:hypothetical protein
MGLASGAFSATVNAMNQNLWVQLGWLAEKGLTI